MYRRRQTAIATSPAVKSQAVDGSGTPVSVIVNVALASKEPESLPITYPTKLPGVVKYELTVLGWNKKDPPTYPKLVSVKKALLLSAKPHQPRELVPALVTEYPSVVGSGPPSMVFKPVVATNPE
jgi:hypothetical protein